MNNNLSGVQTNTNTQTPTLTHTNSTTNGINVIHTALELAKLGWDPIEVERVINAATRLETGTPTNSRLK